MKRIFTSILFAVAAIAASAQNVQDAAAQAALAMAGAQQAEQVVEKPQNWSTNLKTQINIGQTSLNNWAAGGDNTVSMSAPTSHTKHPPFTRGCFSCIIDLADGVH